nr:glycoside hydrolase family 9 protein [Spirochaetaceae bacterium]
MNIFVNHIGYRPEDKKVAVIEGPADLIKTDVKVINRKNGETVYSGKPVHGGLVNKWKDWNFLTFDFSSMNSPGLYYLLLVFEDKYIKSETFELKADLLCEKTMSDLLFYFKTMRCSGEYDKKDHNAVVFGSDQVRDVHGGWYDASGDVSKYLSHLSYANYMNPQQIPMVGWNLIDTLDNLRISGKLTGSEMEKRFVEEILHGADFLKRMQDQSGFFYMTLFDQWSKDLDKRILCSYSGQYGKRWESYQAAYRQGGGVAIAMLARTAFLAEEGDYKPSEYLRAAISGFDHLEKYNESYLDDGKENIIDDYCALLGAAELFKVTEEPRFYQAAEKRALNLVNRIRKDEKYKGWLSSDGANRPYFHAAEAGLPVISLIRFLECAPFMPEQIKEKILNALKQIMSFELSITGEVNNPFGYARQYTKAENREASGAFFVPHINPSKYWWQGENARLGSLSAAALKTMRLFPDDKVFSEKLENYALNQINWIVGCNPYNMSMLQGHGANNPVYEKDYINTP